MNFQWILLAFFLVAILSGFSKARRKSMLRNVLRLGSLVFAFLVSFILQVCGVFQGIVVSVLDMLDVTEMLSEELPAEVGGLQEFISAAASMLVSPIFFFLVFFLLLWICRIVVFFVVRGIEKKKAKAEAAAEAEQASAQTPVIAETAVNEPAPDGEASAEAETETEEISPIAEEVQSTFVPVEEKASKKKKKKYILYPQCAWKRAVSLAAGIIGSILMLGILLTPFFYLMSVATAATDGIEGSDAEDSPIYQVVSVVDEQITSPFNDSFVVKFYSTVGVSDLMNYTIKAGGKIVLDNGKAVYVDDVLKNILTHSVSLAAQVTSAESECSTAKADLNALIGDPFISSMLADVVMAAIADIDIDAPASGENGFGEDFLNNFVSHYKNADKAVIEGDLLALSNAAGVLIENGLLTTLLAEDANPEDILKNKEMLSGLIEAVSGLSSYGPAVEGIFTMGIEVLGEALQIPEDDAAAYDDFIENLLDKMQKEDSTAFDISTVQYYVYNCASQGKKVSSTNGIKGHSQFVAYVAHWEKVQAAFATASEDRSYGYFTMQINGQCYIYDKNVKTIVVYSAENESEYKDKISPVSGLINALTRYSSTARLTKENLYTILSAYAAAATDTESVNLANRMLSRDTFVTKSVTIEKMLASTSFTDWDAETRAADSKICVDIVFNLLSVVENLESMEQSDSADGASALVDQFEILGQTMDDMQKTTCIKKLPPLLIEGLVKNEMFASFMKPSIVFQINDIVEEGDKTYADSMKQIGGLLKWAINSLGGEIQ